ncbi:hypothetical protein ACHWQZ_G007606 [Mnemiopsis leidyi]
MMTFGFLCNKLTRLLKGLVILYMAGQFNLYCTVSCQISIPKTLQEWKDGLGGETGAKLRDLNCNRRVARDTDCTASSKKSKNRRNRRNRKRNSDPEEEEDTLIPEETKKQRCRCRKNKKDKKPKGSNKRAMLDDHTSEGETYYYPPPRPRMKICRDSRCLTFTNGRISFNANEYLIVSHSNSIEVLEGAWELCGEFEDSISCVIMSDDNYLDIFDDESVRVTTFRRLELPERISDIHDDVPRDVEQELEQVTNELSDNLDKMEDVLDKSNRLLMLQKHKRPSVRRKFMKVLDTLGDT